LAFSALFEKGGKMSTDTAKVDKVIVTNQTALVAKYGSDGTRKILSAVQGLISADKSLGLLTRLFLLDDAAAMKKVGGMPVSKATNPKQNKDAIDAMYKALAPDYLLILGAIDIVPHQDLKNPMYSPSNDPDRLAFGDLPYACESKYSQSPQNFFGPTRVVGRLPDVTGAKDPQYLIGLLNNAANYTSVDSAPYKEYCGISAAVWEKSTAMSLTNTFGNATALKTVPPGAGTWPPSLLRQLSHFINCHGAPHDSHFYGQPASGAQDYPIALDARYINGKIVRGTVVAAECCYGAQLYDPSMNNGQYGIANTYLANKAYGFFGSTTIAYGPSEGNNAADLICQYFLQSILHGASLGRAGLEARQKFVHTASMSEPDNIKTIAQFNLYADPSIAPIKVAHEVGPKTPRGLSLLSVSGLRVERAERRRDLFSRGVALSKSQPVTSKFMGKVEGSVTAALQKMATEYGVAAGASLTFDIKTPKSSRFMPKGLTEHEVFPDRVTVIFQAEKAEADTVKVRQKALDTGAAGTPTIIKTVALIVKESKGVIVSVKKIFAR
jgi:hypothetical protein